MWFVSDIGNQPYISIIIGVTCFLLYIFKLKTEAIICILATAGSALSGSLIKILIDRPRPSADLVHVWFKLLDNSFPSGHVLVFTVFFGFLLYLLFNKPKRNVKGMLFSILFFFFIVAIGISRIFLGAHWASDVLGGYLLGILWLIFAIKLYNSYNGKR
jgi:undecaprenyl-diphosphatase